jgi:hypothetical protein
MATEAEIRRRKKQDATRKRVAIWLDPKTTKALDKLRGKTPRAAYVRQMIEEKTR